ncbi:alcohol dehydrogenase catalytic domain-containing protein [Pseudolysinimonas sp.]|uniref:alcohol dehydrogenase catalytic domain-containing protein n=1 Tax=Pseudolysinimonas sp. TaxID=2680009 RepID=UPI003F80F5BF
MKALTWQANRKVETIEVPDPRIGEPTDAIVRITSTAICGSDLHLLGVLGPFLDKGDVLGHEPMGVVVETGSAVADLAVGDRVVIPFVIACGECYQCRRGMTSQCETTRTPGQDTGASLYGYTQLYGSVPGGQAEYLRVRLADRNAIKVGAELPDERYLFLSDILPTAWQGVQYAGVPEGGSLTVLGLGPVGQFASRIGRHLGYDVVAVDPVPERRAMAERHGVATLDLDDHVAEAVLDLTDGRGPHGVVDAVGMEAHGNPVAAFTQHAAGLLPDAIAQKLMQTAGTDRLAAMMMAFDLVQRGGTVSLSGVYGGVGDPLPMLNLFDKQVTIRMGQCNVQRWAPELLPLVEDPSDPLGTEDLVTHHGSLDEAPDLYAAFRDKQDGCVKVVLNP